MARNALIDPSIASLDIAAVAASFGRHLRASNLSPRTVQSYLEAVDLFTRHLVEQGMPTQLSSIRREHVEAFIEPLLRRFKATTAANRYAGLRAFFKWAVDEGEIKESPMAKMREVPQTAAPAQEARMHSPVTFAGGDWAMEGYEVFVIDDHGTVLERFEVEHSEAGLRDLVHRLRVDRVSGIAIERPGGPVVDALLASGWRS